MRSASDSVVIATGPPSMTAFTIRFLLLAASTVATLSQTSPATAPNFLVILTDDQDQLLNSTHRAYMPNLNSIIADQGLQLRNYAVSTSTCCPSRASILTGLFTHNHNITSNLAPYGGFGKFLATRPDLGDSWLPSKLQEAGYGTYLVGKFLNGYTAGMSASDCPRGFTVLDALVEPYVYSYSSPAFSLNCGPMEQLTTYSTDAIRDKAAGYIRDAAAARKPFYLQVNPIAPHQRCTGAEEGAKRSCDNPIPAARHSTRFAAATVPLSPNLNLPLGPALTSNLNLKDDSYTPNADKNAAEYRMRLRALCAVDELVRTLVLELSRQGVLDNTYIIYTSDNGYHMGHHNLQPGKLMPFEEDVRVPFFIRGPGIPRGLVTDYQATAVDLPATVVTLAGLDLPQNWDGYPLPLHRLMPATSPSPYKPLLGARTYDEPVLGAAATAPAYLRDSMPVEMWVNVPGSGMDKVNYRSARVCTPFLAFGTAQQYTDAYTAASLGGSRPGSTLGAGRLLGSAASQAIGGGTLGTDVGALTGAAARGASVKDDPAASGTGEASWVGTCYKYVVWCWGAKSLYDLGLDPYETYDRMSDPRAARLVGRLDALLSVMGNCRGAACRRAYGGITPDPVRDLGTLMATKYDTLIGSLPRFSFTSCERGMLCNEQNWYGGSCPASARKKK